jgi:hypothetical protein
MTKLKRLIIGTLLLAITLVARGDDANTTSVSDAAAVLQAVFAAILVPSVLILVSRIAKRYMRRGTGF